MGGSWVVWSGWHVRWCEWSTNDRRLVREGPPLLLGGDVDERVILHEARDRAKEESRMGAHTLQDEILPHINELPSADAVHESVLNCAPGRSSSGAISFVSATTQGSAPCMGPWLKQAASKRLN